jgi:hypothetical protein
VPPAACRCSRHRALGLPRAWFLLAALIGAVAAEPPGVLLNDLSGTPDPAASGGEAVRLDREGIYCWWDGPALKPGYFEVVARTRATGQVGVLHFVLCQSGTNEVPPLHAVSRTQQGRVEPGEYREVYCGTFFWDGTYTPRVSDWSSPGLLVDWVKLVPVPLAAVRDPDPAKVKSVLAPKLPQPPVIDGDLGEWSRVPALALGPEAARGGHYGGSTDLSGLCRWAWDDRALYVAAQVQDDQAAFLADAGALESLWQFDSIQMAFDAAHDARTPGYAADDYEYGFGLTTTGSKAYRWVAGNNLVLGDVPTVVVAVRRDEGRATTIYEVALPWTELVPFSPQRPHCGMTLIVNDNDGDAAQRAWLEWTPGIAGPKDPSAFGMLTLVDQPPAATETLAWLVVDQDLSDRDQAPVVLKVATPEPLGQVTLSWRLQVDGEDGPAGQLEATLAQAADQVPFDLDLREVGKGRGTLSVEVFRGDQLLATAASRFVRYAVAELQQRLATLRAKQEALWQQANAWREQGGQGWYPRATLGVVGEFVACTAEDLEQRRGERAARTMDDLEAMLGEAEAELAALRAEPARDGSVPTFAPQRLTVRDGAFWQGDQPVFLLGFCGWWRVWTECRRFADFGMNLAEDSIVGPFALIPDCTGEPPKGMLEATDWAWLRGDERGFRYSRMIACNQLPESFAQKYPEATGGGWSGVCTLHPAVREVVGRYLDIISGIASRYSSPAVLVLYGENTHRLSQHPLEVAAFHDWLRRRYTGIVTLNAAWGSAFADFAEVGNGEQAAGPVARYDRGIFNQKLFTDWSAWLVQAAKAKDPRALCTGYPSLLSWDDSSDFGCGIDMEALCNVFDVNGCDTAALDYGGGQWAMNSITGFALPQELLQAFNPEHPNYDPELHLVNLGQTYPPEYVRAALWQGFLHGLSAASLWVYERREGIDSMLTFQPRVMQEYLRTGLDLRRLVHPVRAFQRAPAEAVILYSRTSTAYAPQHLNELRSAYEGTFFLDAKIGFVTERTVDSGSLEGRRLLLVPAASHVSGAVAAAIRQWVADGGTLWLLGECLNRDPANRPLPALPELAAAEFAGVPVRRAALGRGLVILTPPGTEPGDCRKLGEALLATAGVQRPCRLVTPAGEPVDGVEFRTATRGAERLVYAINMNRAPVRVTVSGPPARAIQDLRRGERLGLPLELAPLEVVFGTLEGP